ncbi:MAG: OmpH family outer membrane protein [Alistipes sp.]|jgi:outer membrane protein|nr:OmpH family outer membrane protein [Alistipes sp.]MBQ1952081.1 OmpH family outer membrane protein [Alistipes sp.]MBQ1978595.1 OmpH family outer membrane protein [Alistipes sp.]MBQ5620859.1 OmpH family outer membrane protein [Alistipes sp.]MBQ5654502.1 OmpH family outer membrane protein [Alistipes sp.]
MKNVLKLTLVLAMMLSCTTLFAQKLGRINSQEVMLAMPETAEMQTKLQAVAKDWEENLELINVEFNNKLQEFQKNLNSMSDAARQIKEKDLNDLRQRGTEMQQMAQQDLARQEQELMTPIIEKAQNAIQAVSKAGGFTAVFETGSLVYFDETTLIDITPLVKKELGITETAAAN